ncbi:MAG: GntR family transcriptional regulator, partial [Pseudomonadota bacterium]
PADSRINEVHLAQALGVSRTPLREALAMLLAEDALQAKPRRGMFVRPLTRKAFLDIYQVRPLLDVGALRLAGIPSAKTLTRLRTLNDRLSRARSARRRIDIDDEWHLLLVSDCRNPVLLNLIHQFMLRTRRYELAYLREQQHTNTAVDEYLLIMDALEREELEAACDALLTNLTSGVDPILRWLNERENA